MLPYVQQRHLGTVEFNFGMFLAKYTRTCHRMVNSFNEPRFRHRLDFSQRFADKLAEIAFGMFRKPHHHFISAHRQLFDALRYSVLDVSFC